MISLGRLALAGVAMACAAFPLHHARATTLDDIRHRGVLSCAVSTDQDDYSQFDAHGNLSAFGRDLCRAVAAAVLPDGHTNIIETGDEITAIRAVRDGKADIAFGTTPDPALGLQLGLRFASPMMVDGQGFLVNRQSGFRDAASLRGKKICFIQGTPEAETVRTRLTELGIEFTAFPFSERGEMIGALATGHCDAVTGDISKLANQRQALPALVSNGVVLKQTITVDPWSPVLRDDESQLFAVVSALENGLVSAAVLDIGRDNAAKAAVRPTDPIVARLLGASTWQARGLGVDERFVLRAIEAVGNYDELYRRDVGADSPLGLPVGPNAPLEKGGIMLSTPVAGAR